MSKARLKSVFSRIGGEEKLKEILRDFYHRMSNDILIGFFFSGKDLNAIADQQQAFLSFAVGLRSAYTGKTPTSAHLSLPPILSGHFDRRLVLLKQTLKDHGLLDDDIQTWIEFEEAFRNVIVESKKTT